VIYLDTGCLLKLYYPEAESARVAMLVQGKTIAFVALHELELANALQLKLFRREATPKQVKLTNELVRADAQAGMLHLPTLVWEDVFREAATMAGAHTRRLGCRSLDILHCAASRVVAAESFITTGLRQRKLAQKLGLTCPAV
jgi:hypothetical protein